MHQKSLRNALADVKRNLREKISFRLNDTGMGVYGMRFCLYNSTFQDSREGFMVRGVVKSLYDGGNRR